MLFVYKQSRNMWANSNQYYLLTSRPNKSIVHSPLNNIIECTFKAERNTYLKIESQTHSRDLIKTERQSTSYITTISICIDKTHKECAAVSFAMRVWQRGGKETDCHYYLLANSVPLKSPSAVLSSTNSSSSSSSSGRSFKHETYNSLTIKHVNN
jgi:hypothetical protein